MKINSDFDGGNITCLDASRADDIRLEIQPDNLSEFFQWFYFKLSGARGADCALKITNAHAASYTKGWEGYRAVASTDRKTWYRVPTSYDGTTLIIRHRPPRDAVWYAYFAPYSMERHHDLIARSLISQRARLSVLGETLDGQSIDLLEIGTPVPGRRVLWVLARQHPGETMAEWWMEGFLDRLLDEADPLARSLLSKACFYVVPNMNPDGSRRGHLRTNAAGTNLNREWAGPSLEKSPEVFYVRGRMAETGVDFCLDVHGDEGLPYNFIAGPEGVPSYSKKTAGLLASFKSALQTANPDFQTDYGYPVTPKGRANLSICASNIAESFNCLAMTLEQPFKDAANVPDDTYGWSPARAKKLGASALDAITAVIDDLR